MAAGTEGSGVGDDNSIQIKKKFIRVQGIRKKQREWETTTTDGSSSTNVYTRLQLVAGEHVYDTLRGDNLQEFHIYDSIKVHDDQRHGYTYHSLENSCEHENKLQTVESNTGSCMYPEDLGQESDYITAVERCSDTNDYETIVSIEAPLTSSLKVSEQKCVSDQPNTNGYGSTWESDTSVVTSYTTNTMCSKAPSPVLKADVCSAFDSVVFSSVLFPVCTSCCPLDRTGSCTQCRPKIIVNDDDSDYIMIEETEDVTCKGERLYSSEQYMNVNSLKQVNSISRDLFCRKAFKRK